MANDDAEWHNYQDEIPSEAGLYFVTIKNGSCYNVILSTYNLLTLYSQEKYCFLWYDRCGHYSIDENVIAWQKLEFPEPYKENRK